MEYAETVTFGGSGLNRAAELRRPLEQEKLLASGTAKVTYFWRGKPMVTRGDALGLGWTGADHSVRAIKGLTAFLGLGDDGTPLFAQDISAWQPDELPDTLNLFLDPSEQVHPNMPDMRFVELRTSMTQLSPRDAELAATGRGIMEWHRTHRFCSNCGSESGSEMGGWQRNCPDCGRHHFPRTDPVVIMLILHGNSILLGRSPGWPEGMYSLLAGFVEPGETMEAAVRREVGEEAGIKVGRVSYLASQPWPFPASLMFGCMGEATTKEITIDPNEIEDAVWITREDMIEVQAGRHAKIKPAREGAIAHFLIQNWLSDRLN
ncbi:MAG: NAD(+) diphosphatase [Planktomarina sp.]